MRGAFLSQASHAGALVVLLGGLGLFPACKASPPPSEKPSAMVAQVEQLRSRLLQAAAGVRGAKATPCEESALQAVIGQQAAKVLLVPEAQLKRAASGAALEDPGPGSGALDGKGLNSDFLNQPKLEALNLQANTEEQAILALSKFQDFKSRYPLLGVIDIQSLENPEEKEGQFLPGQFKATLSLVGMGETEILCSATVSAESDVEVAKRKDESMQAALVSDFERRIRDSLRSALTQLSRQLSQ